MQQLVTYIVQLIHKILSKFGINEPTRLAFVKYLFNTGWMFAEKVIFMAIAFFVVIYVARYLEPTQFGLLNYALSFVFIFQAFAKLGLDGIVVRELVKAPDKKLKTLGTSLILKAFGAIISLVLIFVSIQFTTSDYQTKIILIIIALGMLFSTFEVGSFYFESQVKAKYNVMSSSISLVATSVFKLFLIFLEADLIWFAIAYSFEIILKSIGFIVFYQIINKDVFKWKFNTNIAKKLLRDSWPFILVGIMGTLYMRMDQLMLKEMLDLEAVGIYSAALRLSEIWYFIPVAITGSLFPAIIVAKKDNEEFYYKRLKQLFNLLVFIAIIIILPITIFSNFLISLIYGSNYLGSSLVLKIHVWSCFFVFTGNILGKWHIVENKQKILLFRTLFGVVSNVILNLILIPRFEAVGAAYASLFSFFIVGHLSGFLFKDMRKIMIIQLRAVFFIDTIIYIYNYLKNYRNV